MAATPMTDDPPPDSQERWNDIEDGDRSAHDRSLEHASSAERETKNNGAASTNGGNSRAIDQDTKEDYRSDAHATDSGGNPASSYHEKQIKPNKVYIGGLPEHTRQEDLKNCFGKIGAIVNIELKLGYGFVEFETKEAAEESVSKYHEGYFMGNKIRVEISRGGNRAQKPHGEPGACFKCGDMGHWARECPNPTQTIIPPRKATHYSGHHSENGDRSYTSRDYPVKERERDYTSYSRDRDRDRDIEPSRYTSARAETRYSYDYASQATSAPPPPVAREYVKRPASPPRDYRDYHAPPKRDYDEYRTRVSAPAPPPASRGYYPPETPPYVPRSYESTTAPPRDLIERDRRIPPTDRYSHYQAASRPRSPPMPPPRPRDEYDRSQPREYAPPVYRGRPVTPPLPSTGNRYTEYSPRIVERNMEQRYRRRSQSPRPNYRGSYPNEQVDPSYGQYGAPSASYPSNGYSGSSGAPFKRERDYSHRGTTEGYSRRG